MNFVDERPTGFGLRVRPIILFGRVPRHTDVPGRMSHLQDRNNRSLYMDEVTIQKHGATDLREESTLLHGLNELQSF